MHNTYTQKYKKNKEKKIPEINIKVLLTEIFFWLETILREISLWLRIILTEIYISLTKNLIDRGLNAGQMEDYFCFGHKTILCLSETPSLWITIILTATLSLVR